MNKSFSLAIFLLTALALSACSFSDSSKSSSGSSASLGKLASSPSLASSRSSESKQQSYEREVSDYTAEFVKSSNGDLASYRVKLGKYASDYGIANWEEDRTTYVAIGNGLRKASLPKPQYEAFQQSLGDAKAWKMDAIAEGYSK